jgi:hypothetical protein
MGQTVEQLEHEEWVTFPGGELEGRRPNVLCPTCRALVAREAATRRSSRRGRPRPLCFACYRADLARQRALAAAGALDTASPERFQQQLPFEPVNRVRLERLKAERIELRSVAAHGIGRHGDKRRRAQIDARHAIERIASGVAARGLAHAPSSRIDTAAIDAAIRAAELQLPESWLPFVLSR